MNYVVARSIEHEKNIRDKQAKDTLLVIEDSERLRKENKTLENIRVLQKEPIQRLETKAKQNEALYEKMKKNVEDNKKLLEKLARL